VTTENKKNTFKRVLMISKIIVLVINTVVIICLFIKLSAHLKLEEAGNFSNNTLYLLDEVGSMLK
jgi:hypothetical protein